MFWLRNIYFLIMHSYLEACLKYSTVNVLKILTLIYNVGFQVWNAHKMFIRTASREDPDQTASSEAV